MINELIEQIGGRKRLEQIVEFGEHVPEAALMARALLAVLDAKPVGFVGKSYSMTYYVPPMDIGVSIGDLIYTTPPAASETVSNGYKLPDGWKLVPVEPTIEMREAYHKADEDFQERGGISPDSHWAAMLAAAPAPGGE